jgi:secondary thiamine-phosphate synthase enzyme
MLSELTIKSSKREELIDITPQICDILSKARVQSGVIHLFVPHTTAALTINENADPDVKRDILFKLNKEIPRSDGYFHGEGNSDAHIKSSLLGPSLQLIISDSKLLLGTWQGILFCEFDGPRTRRLLVKIISG